MLHPLAIGHEQRTLDRVVDHLEHAVGVVGIDRVCLGGDFTTRLSEVLPPMPEPADGLMPAGLKPGAGIEGLKGPEDYPALLAALAGRGWSDADIAAVSSDNLLGVPPPLPAGRMSSAARGTGSAAERRTVLRPADAGPPRRQSAAPPSASSVAPFTYAASSESSHATSAAISSGLPSRPAGISAASSSILSPASSRTVSPSIVPGAIALTVTPAGARARRGAAREREEAGLRRRVVGSGDATAAKRGVGRDVDDPPGAAIAQVRADGTDPEKRATQVRGEHVVPFLRLDLEEVANDGAGCTVDEGAEVACLVGDTDGTCPRFGLTHVHRDRDGAAPEVGGECHDGIAVEVGEDERPARRRGAVERPRRRFPGRRR